MTRHASHPTSPALLAALLALAACAGPPPAEGPQPDVLDVDLRLLTVPDGSSPDVRLRLNDDAYVTLAFIDTRGQMFLLRQRHSPTPRHYSAGTSLLRGSDIHGYVNSERISSSRSRHEFSISHENYYVAVATADPLDLSALMAREPSACPAVRAAPDPATAIEGLLDCLVSDMDSTRWATDTATWPVGHGEPGA